eukprot:CAMPEP_0113937662 /NCGR_PEP_ID=MMETSP1339-20121228/4234_1 /TAXON_ID=94617 /ORGANISM="Fibrocapsa japonica" /LENGTH=400 /DNA_ID=CAMNT_0000940509 /DNA_START=86 /DNA_END=1288 /DNA_ORIENTATION=- /assembly_acc=CAM_ASM_000762
MAQAFLQTIRTSGTHRSLGYMGCRSLINRMYSSSPISMKLQTGIVGMPNVGKSTLFNALTEQQAAQAANFPFCTIEPNVGIVGVPDPRLQVLEKINQSRKTIPATLEFVDIAGLVKGASKGEGLGNQFLGNIRQVDAVVHVVRCFEDPDVIHVDGSVDPIRDIEIINLELALSDMEQCEKRLAKVAKDRKASPDEKKALEKLLEALNNDQPARLVDLTEEEEKATKALGLLTRKPVIFAANVADSDLAEGNSMVESVREHASKEGAPVVIVSAQVESELVELDPEEKKEFLDALGVEEESCGLRALVRAAYERLDLQTYFTSGETETRAWTIMRGTKAPQAAGVIHSDFERGFIRAETMAYDELVEAGSEKALKEKGRYRSEGKDYIVQEGDVLLFRFNV